MTRRTQPAVITVICDGCGHVAPPEGLEMLVALGWDVSFDEPSGCDWCPTCTSARSDLQATIQRVRELCEAKAQEVAASDPLFGHPCALYVDDILRALEGDA